MTFQVFHQVPDGGGEVHQGGVRGGDQARVSGEHLLPASDHTGANIRSGASPVLWSPAQTHGDHQAEGGGPPGQEQEGDGAPGQEQEGDQP